MKAGVWYVAGFVVAFVYFYVYAVNYIRGVRGDEIDANSVTKDLKHLPEIIAKLKSSSREGRDAEALWPLTLRSGPLKAPSSKKKIRVRKRPIKVIP